MEIRVRAALHALETIATVDLLWLGPRTAVEGSDYYLKRKVAAALRWEGGPKREPLRSIARRFGNQGTSLIGYVPGYHRFYLADRESLAIANELIWSQYDLFYFVNLDTYWYMGMPRPERTIVDLNDVHSLLAEDAWRKEGLLAGRLLKGLKMWNTRREEQRVIRACAASLVCSESDQSRLELDRVEVFPNGYPDYGQATEAVVAGNSNTLLFVGTLKYGPNREGVRFFSVEVLPRIRQLVADAEFLVVGELPEGEKNWMPECPGVRFLGRVEDLPRLIRESAIEVAPLLKGLGTRIKILEAISFGKPVVATTIGAYGISLGPDEGLFREDDPIQLAQTCLRVMRSPEDRIRLGQVGRARVAELYGQEALSRRMAQIVDRALASTSRVANARRSTRA